MPRTKSSNVSQRSVARQVYEAEGHPELPATRVPSEAELLARLDAANDAEWELATSRGVQFDRPRVGRAPSH